MEKVSRTKKRCSSLFGLYDGRTIHTACLPIRAYRERMRLGEGDADGGGEEGRDARERRLGAHRGVVGLRGRSRRGGGAAVRLVGTTGLRGRAAAGAGGRAGSVAAGGGRRGGVGVRGAERLDLEGGGLRDNLYGSRALSACVVRERMKA